MALKGLRAADTEFNYRYLVNAEEMLYSVIRDFPMVAGRRLMLNWY